MSGAAVFRKEGTHVYLGPIRTDVWQNPSQYCDYPPIKINTLIKKLYLQFFILKYIDLFIWLRWVLVAARGLL